MQTIYVNGIELLNRSQQLIDSGVKYDLGSKAKPVTCEPGDIRKIDCSGFVQYMMYHTCNAKLRGGSYYQNKWFEENRFQSVDYASHASKKDNILRLGYFKKGKGMVAGHIWFVLNGMTIESFGGKGPGRRPWNEPKLLKNVQKCYVIGDCKMLQLMEDIRSFFSLQDLPFISSL